MIAKGGGEQVNKRKADKSEAEERYKEKHGKDRGKKKIKSSILLKETNDGIGVATVVGIRAAVSVGAAEISADRHNPGGGNPSSDSESELAASCPRPRPASTCSV